jgi:hypothetical protein
VNGTQKAESIEHRWAFHLWKVLRPCSSCFIIAWGFTIFVETQSVCFGFKMCVLVYVKIGWGWGQWGIFFCIFQNYFLSPFVVLVGMIWLMHPVKPLLLKRKIRYSITLR